MRSRAFRPIAVLLGILLLTNTPGHAGPVPIGEVLQIIGSNQHPPSLPLRGVSQSPSTPAPSGLTPSTSGVDIVASSVTSTSLLTGIASQDPPNTVTTVAPADVEGTACDCG